MCGDDIVDIETESVWTFEGVAISGALANNRLELILRAHVAFWFAWATFTLRTRIWVDD
jgi:hypothetical protein